MTYNGSGEQDIRGIDITKLAKGFGEMDILNLKQFCSHAKTKSREIRWYRKGLSLAAANTPLDTLDTQGVTGSHIQYGTAGALPFVVEQKWERQTSYVQKFFVESPWITIEDIKDTDVDILGTNVRDLVEGVTFQINRRMYDVLTEATTSGTPAPTNVNTDAATAGWATTATCNPILDLLIAKRKLRSARYNPEGAIVLMNELEHQSLLNYLISVKGSSIPNFANDKVKSGIVMNLLGLNIVVNPDVTADWVITFVRERAITHKEFIPLTSAVKSEEGIGKKIRIWEEGQFLLTDPLAVHILSSAS